MNSGTPGTGEILSVSEVNREARRLLEQDLGQIAIVGELSNIARPASGHLYFTLKDSRAQLRCALFRQRQRTLRFRPENGEEVIAFGKISLYEPRGDYQLIVEHLDLAGAGALQREFERLRTSLSEEGLFDPAGKRSLPVLPQRIGVITSRSGAAVRDILSTLCRRFPAVPVLIYPTAVQGEQAPDEIVKALSLATDRAECDVLIVARGGGSIEDLWSFNEERVARAIHDCPIPIVSAVGHETDTTIADFVADVRAPTPTAAAELVVPVQREWQTHNLTLARRSADAMQRLLMNYQQQLDWLGRALNAESPATQLAARRARVALASVRLQGAQRRSLTDTQSRLEHARNRLVTHSPERLLDDYAHRWNQLSDRLGAAISNRLRGHDTRLAVAARGLHAVSPLATLGRGYAIVQDAVSDRVIRDAAEVSADTDIHIRLHKGRLRATTKGST